MTTRIEEMTEQAKSYLDTNQINEAKKLYMEICEQDGTNAEAWLMLGAIHGETGILDEALTCLNKAIELDSKYAEAHFVLAKLLLARGDAQGAVSSARAAVSADPDYVEAYLFLGGILGQYGNYAESESASRKATELAPENPDAHINLANALQTQGRLPEAENSLRQALLLNPTLASAYASLGSIMSTQQRFGEAEENLKRALELQPDLAEAHNNLGLLQMARQDFGPALDSFEKVIALAPGFAPGYANIGNIHLHNKRYDQAIECFNKAVELAPNLAEAYLALGNTWKLTGDRDTARQHYQRAITAKPDYALAHYSLGVLEEESGNFNRALECYTETRRLLPNNIDAQAGIAGIQEKTGDIETAYNTIRTLIDNGAQDVRVGVVFSRLCRHFDKCEEATYYLESLVFKPELNSDQRADVHFALGMLKDRAGEYDVAFTHFSQANEAKDVGYDPDDYKKYVDRVINANTSETLSTLPGPSKASKRPIFIIGMPRSGTTLVEQILSAHSKVAAGGEINEIFGITDSLNQFTGTDTTYPESLSSINQSAIDSMAERYLQRLSQIEASANHVTDKMPHNFQHIGLIHAMFPESPIIHVTRNPVDTCLSCYFHDFAGYQPYTYDLEYLAAHYKQYQRLMQHWKDNLEIPLFDVSYEQLINDQEQIGKALLQHCGLDWEDNCLRFYESDRLAATASYDQVRQPIYRSSAGRWKHYEAHIKQLLDAFTQSA